MHHRVEVDNEVFSYVQQNAEPLVDNFNSAIKRLLGLSEMKPGRIIKTDSTTTPIPDLSLPRDIPQALRQIIEVSYLVSKCGESRTDATRIVATLHDVAPQTVQDKYCRQLDFTAAEFDRLLDETGLEVLRGNLKNRFFALRRRQRLQHFNQYPESISEHLSLLVTDCFSAQHIQRFVNGHIPVPLPVMGDVYHRLVFDRGNVHHELIQ